MRGAAAAAGASERASKQAAGETRRDERARQQTEMRPGAGVEAANKQGRQSGGGAGLDGVQQSVREVHRGLGLAVALRLVQQHRIISRVSH